MVSNNSRRRRKIWRKELKMLSKKILKLRDRLRKKSTVMKRRKTHMMLQLTIEDTVTEEEVALVVPEAMEIETKMMMEATSERKREMNQEVSLRAVRMKLMNTVIKTLETMPSLQEEEANK